MSRTRSRSSLVNPAKATKLKRWGLLALSIVLFLLLLQVVTEANLKEVRRPEYGVSFSTKYAQELGVDWRQNYLALLQDLDINRLRLMSYWDHIEPKQGSYDFKALDWQFDQAARHGAQISLGLGLRQPRWPECHGPVWFNQLSAAPQRQKQIRRFIKKVVRRYRNHPALQSYQLENEALNTQFGHCQKSDFSHQSLQKEFQLVKKLDHQHPVWMSLSDQHGLPLGQPTPDKYGFSIYRRVHNHYLGPIKGYVTYPTPLWYHRLRASWIRTFKQRAVFIHELQAEPWGPSATKNLSLKEQDKSMSPERLAENLRFGRRVGAPEIYLWGGEWWYWRKTVLHDDSIWRTIKHQLKS